MDYWQINDVTIYRYDVIVKFFDVFVFLLSILVTGRSFMSIMSMTSSEDRTISAYKGLIRNLEIGKTPVWVLSNIWRLEQVKDTNLCTNVSNKKLLNTAKYQGYSFHRFWVIKGKATVAPLPPRLGLKWFAISLAFVVIFHQLANCFLTHHWCFLHL